MALPLLWLGAAAFSAFAVNELDQDRKAQQSKRGNKRAAQTLASLDKHQSPVKIYPSEVFVTEQRVPPKIGAIVCCTIAGVLEHTGIWLGDDTIAELDGNGLIKPISSQRFLKERSGKQIFIACDSLAEPLAVEKVAEYAAQQLFQYQQYDVINNNCHQFVWQCFQLLNMSTPSLQKNRERQKQSITTFKQLNEKIAHYFNRVIYWDAVDLH